MGAINQEDDEMKTIVIGASSGFGKGIAEYLTAHGVEVVKLSRSICDFDVTDYEKVRANLEWHANQYDTVIYCAGKAIDLRSIENGVPSDWKDVMDSNAMGILNVLKCVSPTLRQFKGTFIAIGSIASELAYEGGSDYCAAKAACKRIVQSYRAEMLGTGVRVSLIDCGLGNTDFQKNRYKGDMERAAKHYSGIKQLEPEDMGRLVQFIKDSPAHVNLDEIIIKPVEQLSHGKLKAITL